MTAPKMSRTMAVLVALFATAACSSEPIDQKKSAIVIEPGGMCPIHRTTVECRGETIAHVSITNDATHLIIQLEGTGGFLIAGADIHAGLGPAPRRDGDFDVASFPFHYDFASPRGTVEIRISLAELGATCGSTLTIAIHVRTVRLDGMGAVIEEKNGFARSDNPFGTGFCFYYEVCCPPPEMDAGMPEDDAGTPEMDAGMPEEDAGMPEEDAGGPEGCVLTQGFWQNNPEDWPVMALTIAGELYTQAELLAIFALPTAGDSSISLAHQVITAMLNVANGAPPPTVLGDALAFLAANADADGRLPFGFTPGSAVHMQASVFIDALADFNEGSAGVIHCDQRPGVPGDPGGPGGPGMGPDADFDVDESIDEAIEDAMR